MKFLCDFFSDKERHLAMMGKYYSIWATLNHDDSLYRLFLLGNDQYFSSIGIAILIYMMADIKTAHSASFQFYSSICLEMLSQLFKHKNSDPVSLMLPSAVAS